MIRSFLFLQKGGLFNDIPWLHTVNPFLYLDEFVLNIDCWNMIRRMRMLLIFCYYFNCGECLYNPQLNVIVSWYQSKKKKHFQMVSWYARCFFPAFCGMMKNVYFESKLKCSTCYGKPYNSCSLISSVLSV